MEANKDGGIGGRITLRRWGPDCARVDAAEEICGPIRRGEIDGVSVDLRHPDIAADDWEPRPWWHMASDSRGSAGLAFPSDGELKLPALKAAVNLRPGDRVSVVGVVQRVTGPAFLHAHDRYVIEADIEITTAGGDKLLAPKRLPFYGVTGLRRIPPGEAFDRMARRAAATVGLSRLGEYWRQPSEARKRGLDDEAAYHLAAAESHFRQLARAMADKEHVADHFGDEWAQEHLADMLNSAALGGYLLSRSEGKAMEDRLESQNAILDAGRLKNKDYDGRRVRAREIWEAHPRYTLNQVAQIIAQELNREKSSISTSLREEVPPTSPSFGRLKKSKKAR